jgi:hypothetical protein
MGQGLKRWFRLPLGRKVGFAKAHPSVGNVEPTKELPDHDGTPIKSIPLQGGLTDDPAIKKGESGDSLDAAKSIRIWFWLAVHTSQVTCAAVQPSRRDLTRMFEISDGGFVRNVPIAAPPGYLVDSFVPSAKRWVAIFRRSDLSQGRTGIDSSASGRNYLMAN